MVHDQPFKSNTCQQEEYEEGMDELEAELEVEFERLQVHFDRDNLLKHPQQQMIKVHGIMFRSVLCFLCD